MKNILMVFKYRREMEFHKKGIYDRIADNTVITMVSMDNIRETRSRVLGDFYDEIQFINYYPNRDVELFLQSRLNKNGVMLPNTYQEPRL